MKPEVLLRLGVIAGFLAMTASVNAGEQGCGPSDADEHRTNDGAWRIVATDSGYDSPPCIPAGLRHLEFENRGSEIHELKVVDDGSADSTLPRADVTVTQVDFRFEIVGKFRRGPQVIRFETAGPSMHEADIFRLNDGMDVDDLRRWKKSGKDGPAPAMAFGGALDNHDIRRIVWLKTDLVRGRYVLWCGMPMSTDPAASATDVTHADVGMVHRFNVD